MMHCSDQDETMFAALRRYHLRHPGTVPAAVVKVIYKNTVTLADIGKARTEYVRLGLHLASQPKPRVYPCGGEVCP
jgi:hypothetical protein